MVQDSLIATHRARSILAAVLLGLFAATPISAASNEGKVCTLATATGCSLVHSDIQVIPQGTTSAEIDYTVTSGVCPLTEYCCPIYTTCSTRCSITYAAPTIIVTVMDSSGAVLFTDTQPATPTLSDASPSPPAPVQNFVRNFDVSALTAAGDATVTIQVQACNTSDNTITARTCNGNVQASISFAIPRDPRRFVFDLDQGLAAIEPNQAKLLTHKYRDDDTYFSIYQRATPVTDPSAAPPAPGAPPPVPRPQMNITGSVGSVPPGGPNDVYFKLLDLKDPAPYAASDAHDGDNADILHPAVLMLADGTRRTAVGGGVLHGSWDSSTRKTAIILEGTDQYAGDNYQIEASFDPAFPCENVHDPNYPCATSAIITAWKRVYLEVDAMFRRGAFLTADAPAGSHTIMVREISPGEPPAFLAGDSITLIHGNPGPYAEDVSIATNLTDAHGAPLDSIEDLHNGTWLVHLASTLIHKYDGPGPGLRWYYADAAGIQGSNFSVDTSELPSFYAGVYVDVKPLDRQPFSDFPFVAVVDPTKDPALHLLLSRRFFYDLPLSGLPNGNIFHVIGANRHIVTTGTNPATGAQTCSTDFGDTVAGIANYAYVYVGGIEGTSVGPLEPCTFQLPLHFTSILGFVHAAVAHESLHLWRVNHDSAYPQADAVKPLGLDGHCIAAASVPAAISGDVCLMNRYWPLAITNWSQLDQPRYGLHWLAHGADSEYTQVRGHDEPITK